MFINENIASEISFFRRTNEHYEINAGKSTCTVANASDDILYMAMTASMAMDYFEEGFFENYFITDKSISGKNELQIDAYAFIETENSSVKQLHIFQYKLYKDEGHSVSPVELLNFVTLVNNHFVHPDFAEDASSNEVIQEIKEKFDEFLNGRRGRRISVHCHFINNDKGITNKNSAQIMDVMSRFLNDKQIHDFTIQVYGAKDIIELAHDGKIHVGSETLEMVVDSPNYSFRLEDNTARSGIGLPKKVIVCMCNVNEFIRLQNKYHHNQLYGENIRLYLGDRGSVNKDIIGTITSTDSIWFPYMNNGISIICDKLTVGNTNTAKKTQQLVLENMQIINGCQTVNALYSAKYGENTKDNFRAANVMVRIYEIDPIQADFKMNIIKATNNQNAVKSYSLMANDPIQKETALVLSKFDIIYDRKGESKLQNNNKPVIAMTTAALAYRAVYQFEARSLRSGLGKTRVFMKGEYEKVFDSHLLEEESSLPFVKRCCEILIATTLLDTVRDMIATKVQSYINKIPIFKKSAYHMAGYLYAKEKRGIDEMCKKMCEAYMEDNEAKLKGIDFSHKISDLTRDAFGNTASDFGEFYNSVNGIDKTDIDNLLKSKEFDTRYKARINDLISQAS